MLDEFQWENEWVDENCDELTWGVDEAIGASDNLWNHNLPMAAAARAAASVSQTYSRKRPRIAAAPDITEEDDDDHDARDEAQDQMRLILK